jgi:hypothetical protein
MGGGGHGWKGTHNEEPFTYWRGGEGAQESILLLSSAFLSLKDAGGRKRSGEMEQGGEVSRGGEKDDEG